ncbi:unnamed protein product [Cylicocyclus nassatus]|uniref:C-type lectin n=1 Tax=Cylicocyclus nassatus TaxID=53992 RepID=A0AA36M9R1_CYLNA|nr:unnamed protein product [Cylicocyclus nassatus]
MLLYLVVFSIGLFLPGATSSENYKSRECPCTISKLWLDISFAIDNSESTAEGSLKNIAATVGSIFGDVKVAPGDGYHTRIAFATHASTVKAFDLDHFTSIADLMNEIELVQPTEAAPNVTLGLMIADALFKGPHGFRQYVKPAIFLFVTDFREKDFNNTKNLASTVRQTGTEIIIVTFGLTDPTKIEALKEVASPGLLFSSTTDDLSRRIQQKLCDINCFCKTQWHQLKSGDGDSAVKYGECLKIGGMDANWRAAKRVCISLSHQQGHLVSILDETKHEFLIRTFMQDSRTEYPYMFHIGLSYDKEKETYVWEQPGKSSIPLSNEFTKWESGFPDFKGNNGCVLNVQSENLSSLKWQNVDCTHVSKKYICQTNTCDTDNYCSDSD